MYTYFLPSIKNTTKASIKIQREVVGSADLLDMGRYAKRCTALSEWRKTRDSKGGVGNDIIERSESVQ